MKEPFPYEVCFILSGSYAYKLVLIANFRSKDLFFLLFNDRGKIKSKYIIYLNGFSSSIPSHLPQRLHRQVLFDMLEWWPVSNNIKSDQQYKCWRNFYLPLLKDMYV